LNNKYL